jgi:hypothetical protein
VSIDPLSPIEEQLQGERAAALGEAGRRLEAALGDLANGDTDDRLDEAGTAAWHFMIVRESLGMYDHKAAFAIYQVPDRVIARVGVMRPIRPAAR